MRFQRPGQSVDESDGDEIHPERAASARPAAARDGGHAAAGEAGAEEAAQPADASPPGGTAPKKAKGLRLVAAAALLLGFLVLGHVTGASEHITVANLRGWMADAGAWGVLLFVAVFLVGELLQVPGLVFVAAAVLSYGRLEGGLLAFFTAVLSVCFSFAVVRLVGGKALADIKQPWVRSILLRLEDHPVATIAVLRTVLVMSPPLNYALALSSLRFRDYLLGSALGMLPPILLFVVFFDQAMQWFGVGAK